MKGSAERQETLRYLLMLLPALLVLAVLFAYPLLGIVNRSVYKTGYTLDFYRQIFRVPVYLQVLWGTFRVSALVTLLCLALGYPLAYVLASCRPRTARLLTIIVILPFFTSIIVRTYAWMVLLGRNGIVNQYLMAAGPHRHAPAAPLQPGRRGDRHELRAAALHGADGVQRDAGHRSRPRPRGA